LSFLQHPLFYRRLLFSLEQPKNQYGPHLPHGFLSSGQEKIKQEKNKRSLPNLLKGTYKIYQLSINFKPITADATQTTTAVFSVLNHLF